MEKRFKIKTSENKKQNINDTETLFRDLKNRDSKIQHLWSQQADILRAYHNAIDDSQINSENIALELPTGAGKTLVGLLIAEWRRRYYDEKVVYLCPTRQLAKQVGLKATEYGIKAYVFVGKQTDYPTQEFNQYRGSQAVAITTYSGIFNTHPKIDSADAIILDDAHAGENFISDLFSIKIFRNDHEDIYNEIIRIYSQEIRSYQLSIYQNDEADFMQKKESLYLLAANKFIKRIDRLSELLEEKSNRENKLIFPWSMVRGHLYACHLFMSWSEILIRPWLPPSMIHFPFANAKQRIYMSATLGACGELERITGVKKIHRIPVPAGWERQGTGRRLFLFPDRSFEKEQYLKWLSGFINKNERTLVLTPNRFILENFKKDIEENGCTHQVLYAGDVEDSLDPFIGKKAVILALTNRYDGLDLPDESCRILIVSGLPASVNLHESFLWSKLCLNSLLKDRIRTRITQASGRCTRSSTDYAVIVMVGEDVFDFCIKKESQNQLHPELKAELTFGLDNSDQTEIEYFDWITKIFLNKEEGWADAEEDINKRRDESKDTEDEYTDKLKQIVEKEVQFNYDLWNEKYDDALSGSKNIVEMLTGGKELKGYRALWHYFTGIAAILTAQRKNENTYYEQAVKSYKLASKTDPLVQWFARLPMEIDTDHEEEESYFTVAAVENVCELLTQLGTEGIRFGKRMKEYKLEILSDDSDTFDRGITNLGKLLGFKSEKPKGKGTPDSLWKINHSRVILFEGKRGQKDQNGISIETCRQAKGHENWYKSKHLMSDLAKIDTVVVSPRKYLEKDALPHSEGLYYMHIDEIRALFQEAEDFVNYIRSKCGGLEKENMLTEIQKEIVNADLIPQKIFSRLLKQKLSKLMAK